MSTLNHRNIVGSSIHPPHKREFVNSAARLAYSDFSESDINTLAVDLDTWKYFLLTSISPITWKTIKGIPIEFGISNIFGDSAVPHAVDYLGSDKVCIGYSVSSTHYVIIGNIVGDVITFGSPNEVPLGVQSKAMIVMDATHILCMGRPNSNPFNGRLAVGVVSGTTVTFGSSVAYGSNSSNSTNLVRHSATKACVVFCDYSGVSVQIVNISGNVVSLSGAASFATGVLVELAEAELFDTDKIFIAYREGQSNSNASGILRSCVASISGSSVSFGVIATFLNDVSFSGQIKIVPLTSTKVVISYFTNIDSKGKALVANISGTVITYGSTFIFENVNSLYWLTSIQVSNSKACFIWNDTGNIDMVSLVCEVSGDDLTFSMKRDYTGGNYAYHTSKMLDNTRFCVAIYDYTTSKGRATLGTV